MSGKKMIDKEEFKKASFEENQKFIKKILKLATLTAFTKDDLLLLIKWQNAIIEKMINCWNCKHYKVGDTTCLKGKPHNSGGCFKDWEFRNDR